MMYSAYKLNNQGDKIQPWCTLFPIWNQCVVPCPVLTVASWPAYRFLKSQMVWYSHFVKNFPQFIVIHTVKGFSMTNEAEVFLEFSCFIYDPEDVDNLNFGSSAFSKSRIYIWKFLVYIMLKPSLKDFEYYLASIWNKHDCMVIWTIFDIFLLWDWNENWPFPVLWLKSILLKVNYDTLRIYATKTTPENYRNITKR